MGTIAATQRLSPTDPINWLDGASTTAQRFFVRSTPDPIPLHDPALVKKEDLIVRVVYPNQAVQDMALCSKLLPQGIVSELLHLSENPTETSVVLEVDGFKYELRKAQLADYTLHCVTGLQEQQLMVQPLDLNMEEVPTKLPGRDPHELYLYEHNGLFYYKALKSEFFPDKTLANKDFYNTSAILTNKVIEALNRNKLSRTDLNLSELNIRFEFRINESGYTARFLSRDGMSTLASKKGYPTEFTSGREQDNFLVAFIESTIQKILGQQMSSNMGLPDFVVDNHQMEQRTDPQIHLHQKVA